MSRFSLLKRYHSEMKNHFIIFILEVLKMKKSSKFISLFLDRVPEDAYVDIK